VPIIKIAPSKYLIGVEPRMVDYRGHLIVRVGGGYSNLQEYLEQQATEICFKMHKMMDEHKMTLAQLIEAQLKKYSQDQKGVVDHFLKNFDAKQERLFLNTIMVYKYKLKRLT